ncbi:hypothetical protein ACQKTA_07105 [Enterococcus sp. 22-H-5-01]|uniref:hypothetical protein n=1 Tax=Enterococcus sp. 22-H-5-01 TaxID=3418555 RepID=UPI003D02E34F
MDKVFKNSRYLKITAHIFSISYLATIIFLVIHQKEWIQGIVKKYFSLSFRNVLLFIAGKNWTADIEQRLRYLGREMMILLGVELSFCILGFIIIIILFLRVRKIGIWRLSEKLVFTGYMIMLIVLSLTLFKMGTEIHQTYLVIEKRINSMSVSEIQLFQDKVLVIFQQSNLSLDHILPSLIDAIEQLQKLISTTKKIAGIPSVIESSYEKLIIQKNWFLGCSIIGLFIIIIGHLNAGINWLRQTQLMKDRKRTTKKIRQIDIDERLTKVMEQQEELINQLIKSNNRSLK